MKRTQVLFLEALKASLENKHVQWQEEVVQDEWMEIIHMAQVHQILPMIYEAVCECAALKNLHPAVLMRCRQEVIRSVALQTMKTTEFRSLYQSVVDEGIRPCVVKGIVCRNLYPNPDARASGDEDLLIKPEWFHKTHELFANFGMIISDSNLKDIEAAYEVPYGKPGSPIYIELHKYLFPTESQAYGDLNRYFDQVHENLIEMDVQGVRVYTMNYTDHLFYLICHAFKHFLHSGFGIRQVCDINLFANAYGGEIDWQYILENCREIRADLFAASMFAIGEKYLTFDKDKAAFPESWRDIEVDESDMLADLLDSGVYGQADMSRRHSSNITLNAVIADKRGEKAGNGIISSVCLPLRSMEKNYPYLTKYPFLLPVAWGQRVWKYKKETANRRNDSAAESIKIGNQRVELMRKYGIIK